MGSSDELLTRYEVAQYLKIHVASLSRLRKANPDFPQPVKVGTRLIRWTRRSVQDWLERSTRQQ